MAEAFFHDIWSNLAPIDSKFEGEKALDELYKMDTPGSHPGIRFQSKKFNSSLFFFILRSCIRLEKNRKLMEEMLAAAMRG